jgi:hypothetical protein
MSSLPPPPPGPLNVPPPPPYAPQAAAPAQPAPTRRTGLIVAAVVAAVALGVGAFVLLSGGDDDKGASASLPTSSMLVAVQELVEQADAAPAESEDLDSCPGGDLAALALQGPPEVQAVAGRSTDSQDFVYQPDLAGALPIVNCTLDDSTFESGVGLAFGEVVGDYRAELIRLLPEFELTFDAETPHEGGTLLRFCATPLQPEAGFRAFCETDWYDDNVWVGAYLASDDSTSAITEEWLIAILPGVVNEAAASSASAQTATT